MKRVVFNSPYQESATHVETGIDFVRGVPQTVTDEQAAKILEIDEVRFHDPNESKPRANANFGKPRNQFFSLVEDAPPAKSAPAPSSD